MLSPYFLKIRKLLRLELKILEIEENVALTNMGDERVMSLKTKETLSHEETWSP